MTLFTAKGLTGITNNNPHTCNIFNLTKNDNIYLSFDMFDEIYNNDFSLIDFSYNGGFRFLNIYLDKMYDRKYIIIKNETNIYKLEILHNNVKLIYEPVIEGNRLTFCIFKIMYEDRIIKKVSLFMNCEIEPQKNIPCIDENSIYYSKIDLLSSINKYEKNVYLVIRSAMLGDVCMALTVLASIKKIYPNAIFDFAVCDSYKEIVKKSGLVRNVFVIDDDWDLPLPQNPNILNWSQDSFKNLDSCIAVVDCYASTSPFKNVKVNADHFKYPLDIARSSELVNFLDTSKFNIGLSLSSNAIYKSLDRDSIEEIANQLLDKGFRVINFGGGPDIDHEDYVNAAFDLSVYELLHLVNEIDLLISVDTGTMHLASMVGTPFHALFFNSNPSIILKHVLKSETNKCMVTKLNKKFKHLCSDNIDTNEILKLSFRLIGLPSNF